MSSKEILLTVDRRGVQTKPAVFLDRDGTVNIEKNYVFRPEDWEWTPGAIAAIRRFNKLGLLVVVVSNQAGIARGLYTAHDVDRLHEQVEQLAANDGARIDAFYYCPHHPDYGDRVVCDCRKPKPGLLVQAQQQLAIDMGKSFLIGDKAIDIEAARAVGVQPILVLTGYGSEALGLVVPETPIASNLGEAAEIVFEISARGGH